MATAKAYERLAEKIGASGYPSYYAILENQLTPDEADFIVDLAEGKTPEQLAKELKMDLDSINTRIEDMAKKRVILRGKGTYTIPRSPRFFPRGPQGQKTDDLWTVFFRSGDYQKNLVDGWIVRMNNGGPPSHKVIPARKAFFASPNIKPEEILWYESMDGIFNHAKSISQGGLKEDGSLGIRRECGCGCRAVWNDACDAPGGCTGWEWKPGEWGNDETMKAEQARAFRPRQSFTPAEALAACDKMEDYGLIHISPNTAQITSTCNCCSCCCVIMQPMTNYGNVYKMLAPSRYRAVIDAEKCTGCQTCVERCHFNAIEMRKVAGSKKMKASIVNEHCMGCGLCIFKCSANAMHLESVRPVSHIPTTPWISPSTFAGQTSRK